MSGFTSLTADDPRSVAGYQLHARIGAGGMGAVYLSFTPGGRPIAVKVIQQALAGEQEFRSRFRHEVAAAQRVQGLYTAPVIDADTDAPIPWLATAYVPGPSLQQAVDGQGPLPLATVFRLMAGVAEALGVIHAAGLVHRDLKPSNVLLAEDGPRVIDFGIARAADATSLTRTGVRVGTPSFMTPEQVRGTPVRPATDVFALGQLCVFAATGQAAFGEGPTEAVFYRIAYEQPQLDDCPEPLRAIVERCLAKDQEDRPTVPEVIELARAETADDPMGMAEGWLPPAVAATLVAYDPQVARGAAQAAQTEVVRPAPQLSISHDLARQPTLLGTTGPNQAPGGGGLSMSAVVALTALVAAAVLLATVIGARLMTVNGSPAASSSSISPSPHPTETVTTAPNGTITTMTVTPRPAPTHTTVIVTPAPSGYTAYSEAGWGIDLPAGWSRRLKAGDTSGSVFWYAPDGVSYLQVDPQSWGDGDAQVQAQRADSVASRSTSRFPGYQLLGFSPVGYQDGAVDWDFTFQDPTGAGTIHGRDRFFQASGRPFAIYLRALDSNWLGYQDALAHAYDSFHLL